MRRQPGDRGPGPPQGERFGSVAVELSICGSPIDNRSSKSNWMHFPSGKSGFDYSVNFCRRDGRPAFRFELYVDGKDEDDVDRRFTPASPSEPDLVNDGEAGCGGSQDVLPQQEQRIVRSR